MTPPADRSYPCRCASPGRAGPVRAAAALLSSAATLALLAACAATPDRPAIPVAQETAQYRAHARSYYAPPGPADDPWGPYITEASQRYDVPDAWIRAVMGRESGGRQFSNGTLTTSPVGAMGLMQLMAPTYDDMRVQYRLGDDAFEPHDNIMAGTAYIRQMYDIYGSPGFLAAYNTGPGRLDDFLTRNRSLPHETRQYVAIIGPQIAGIWPNNRSQTDLLVASHDASAAQYAAAQTSDTTRSVRAAWTHRRDPNNDADQPVQVAEAPAAAAGSVAAPSYTSAWNSLPVGGRAVVASAAVNGAAPDDADGVRRAWAARGSGSTAPAAPARNWTLAPTDTQVAAAVLPASVPASPEAAPEMAPEPARVRLAAAEVPARAERQSRFHLIRQAMAEPAPLLRDAGHTQGTRNWSVQVGAFGTAAQASEAVGAAQSHAPSLSRARAEVAGVRQGHNAHLYRARLTGLSRGDALQACERLGHGRSNCMVVSPDARS